MEFLLWLAAVALVIAGIYYLFKRQILLGVVLIILGFLVGPGGVSLFDFDDDDRGGASVVQLN